MKKIFSDKDIEYLKKYGKNIKDAKTELDMLLSGIKFIDIIDSARPDNDGIIVFEQSEFERYKEQGIKIIDEELVTKFVPASGAASRMFKKLHKYKNLFDNRSNSSSNNSSNGLSDDSEAEIYDALHRYALKFTSQIDRYAFYEDLKKTLPKKDISPVDMISYLLTDKGLGYSKIPKAFVKFHSYGVGKVLDAFEEHIVEGLSSGIKTFHFTISKEHEHIIKNRIKEVSKKYDVNISYSFQEPSTDTIALDKETKMPFRKEDGNLLLRKGGNGALLKNVSDIRSDYIIVKNIDNIPRKEHHKIIIDNILMNIGFLLELKTKVFDMIDKLESKTISVFDAIDFFDKELKIKVPNSFLKLNVDEQYKILISKLHRPIKVCQMVENKGAPGGGPVWIKGKDGFVFLRIAEQAECKNGAENIFMKKGTHFNPVNLVLSTKDKDGNFYDLKKFSNPDACFISEKSYDGKDIYALEYPGLWNGAMEDFITIFVEAPIETFHPVKYIEDLLNSGHLNNN